MAVLKIRNENGGITKIRALKGVSGKCAHEYAQEAGYTGTKEDFAMDLANATENLNTHKEDPNAHADIRALIEANKVPSVTESDNGKILMVTDGKWKAVNIPSVEEGEF